MWDLHCFQLERTDLNDYAVDLVPKRPDDRIAEGITDIAGRLGTKPGGIQKNSRQFGHGGLPVRSGNADKGTGKPFQSEVQLTRKFRDLFLNSLTQG